MRTDVYRGPKDVHVLLWHLPEWTPPHASPSYLCHPSTFSGTQVCDRGGDWRGHCDPLGEVRGPRIKTFSVYVFPKSRRSIPDGILNFLNWWKSHKVSYDPYNVPVSSTIDNDVVYLQTYPFLIKVEMQSFIKSLYINRLSFSGTKLIYSVLYNSIQTTCLSVL